MEGIYVIQLDKKAPNKLIVKCFPRKKGDGGEIC